MRQPLLFLCLLSFMGANAQSFYPSAYDMPQAGFEEFRIDNPYITIFYSDPNNASDWIPQQRLMKYKAPNVPYTGTNRTSLCEANIWTEVQSALDSFVLDGAGLIVSYYSNSMYNYPGFSNQYKVRYNMTYNSESQLTHLKSYSANPPTSNNYVLSTSTFITYDDQGRRIKDSMAYGNNPPYLTYYTYDGQGNIILDVTMQNGDTSSKTFINYNSNNLIESYAYFGFDNSTDEWTLYNTDTFSYTNNLVSQHIAFGMLFIDGNMSFGPYQNEIYTYTGSGKLESIERLDMETDVWLPHSKTIFTYGSNNKPTVGYTYLPEGNGWSTVPSNKYLFDNFVTSTPSIGKEVEFTLFPNPANDVLFVKTQNQQVSIELTDIKGHLIFKGNVSGDAQIPTESIPNGLYFITVSSQQGSISQRIMINH